MNYELLKKQIEEIFKTEEVKLDPTSESEDYEIKINDYETWIEILVLREYDWTPIPFNYNISEKLSELFGTREFDVNKYSMHGCETCDYGSRYGHELCIRKENLNWKGE